MKVTFSHFGNYNIAFKALFEKMGFEVVLSQKIGPKDIENGAKISPEMFCLPFKANVGSYLASIEKGADTIFMWDNCGTCRQRYYGVIQEKVLKDNRYNIPVINFTAKNSILKLKKLSGLSFFQMLVIGKFILRQINLIEEIEKLAKFYRPREKKKGETNEVMKFCLGNLIKIRKERELSKFKKEVERKFAGIEIEKNRDLLKVGIIGEIYTVIEEVVNHEIEAKLGKMGIEVERDLTLTEFMKNGIFPWKKWKTNRLAKPYLKSSVGGHGINSVAEMIDYANKGFDGVVQLLPLACMPETLVRPILQKIHQETGIPFLSISLDEQTAEAGIDTRLEAFVDVVKNYHENKKH